MNYTLSLMKGIGIATIVSAVMSESNVEKIVLLMIGILVYSVYNWGEKAELEDKLKERKELK